MRTALGLPGTDKDGKYVLVYDNLKCQRRRRELPHHRHHRSPDHRPAAASR